MRELIGLPPMKNPRQWYLCLEFKAQDAWIGAYWRRDGNCLDVWVCFLPFLPLHFSYWGYQEQECTCYEYLNGHQPGCPMRKV